MRTLILLFFALIISSCQSSNQESPSESVLPSVEVEDSSDYFITKTTSKSANEIIDSLKSGIDKRGLSLFTEVPHHKGTEKARMQLPITHVLIFGNPKVGTKLMLCDQRIGYELPLKILVASNTDGGSSISYRDPKSYAKQYELDDCQEILEKIKGMLESLTNEVL